MALAKLDTDPRLTEGPKLFASLVDIFRKIATVLNPAIDWVNTWTGITATHPNAPTDGSTYLYIRPSPAPGHAVLALDASGAFGDYINSSKNGVIRWQLAMPDATAETGSNAGSNLSLNRYSDSGTLLGTPLQINRANGNVAFAQNVSFATSPLGNTNFYLGQYAGTPLLNFAPNYYLGFNLSSGQLIWQTSGGRNVTIDYTCNIVTPGNVNCANLTTSAAVQVGSGLTMQAGSIQCAAGSGIAFGPSDFYAAQGGGYREIRFSGQWGLYWRESDGWLGWFNSAGATLFSVDPNGNTWCNANITANSTVYSAWNGGFNTGSNYGADGSNYYTQGLTVLPNWGPANLQGYHYPTVWAGFRMYASGSPIIEYHINSASITAPGGFQTSSDIRIKEQIKPIENALAIVEGSQAYTYKVLNTSPDFPPEYRAGLIAQDVLPRLRVAVTNADAWENNPDVILTLDYSSIAAVNSQAISELLAKVNSLETRVSALEAA
jgi:hypothetical protein